MPTDTTARPEPSLHLPPQAQPVRRDVGPMTAAVSPDGGVAAADCGDLTGMARELCYASQYGIYF